MADPIDRGPCSPEWNAPPMQHPLPSTRTEGTCSRSKRLVADSSASRGFSPSCRRSSRPRSPRCGARGHRCGPWSRHSRGPTFLLAIRTRAGRFVARLHAGIHASEVDAPVAVLRLARFGRGCSRCGYGISVHRSISGLAAACKGEAEHELRCEAFHESSLRVHRDARRTGRSSELGRIDEFEPPASLARGQLVLQLARLAGRDGRRTIARVEREAPRQ